MLNSTAVLCQEVCNAEKVFTEYTESCVVYTKEYYCINASLPPSLSEASNTTFTWLMGDGNKKTGKTIQHCYKNYGKYTITLLSKSYIGKTAVTDISYHEVDISDFAIFSLQRLENKQFYFDASEAFINNDFQINNYYWDFGDGSFKCGGSNPLIYHQYQKLESYEVRLIIEGINKEGEKKRVCGAQKLQVK